MQLDYPTNSGTRSSSSSSSPSSVADFLQIFFLLHVHSSYIHIYEYIRTDRHTGCCRLCVTNGINQSAKAFVSREGGSGGKYKTKMADIFHMNLSWLLQLSQPELLFDWVFNNLRDRVEAGGRGRRRSKNAVDDSIANDITQQPQQQQQQQQQQRQPQPDS